MKHKKNNRWDADKKRIRIEQSKESSRVITDDIKRDPADNITEGDAKNKRYNNAGDWKADIPQLAPPPHGLLTAEFNGNRAEDQAE